MMDRFKVPPRHASPQAELSLQEECDDEAHRFPTAPRGISHHRSRPVSGLAGSGVSPSRELALTVAVWIDTPAHAYRCGGSRGFGRAGRTSFPFHPGARTRRDTSNERVDCTTQVAGFRFAVASGIYIENESLQ